MGRLMLRMNLKKESAEACFEVEERYDTLKSVYPDS